MGGAAIAAEANAQIIDKRRSLVFMFLLFLIYWFLARKPVEKMEGRAGYRPFMTHPPVRQSELAVLKAFVGQHLRGDRFTSYIGIS